MSPSDLLVVERPSAEAGRPADATKPSRRPWLRKTVVLFATAFALYIAVGAVLVFVFHFMMGDAVARVANASYALFSRDPHLGSVGFVWPPLPTLVLLPLLPFKALFPALLDRGFAGNIASAAFMAGAVVQLHGALVDRGTSRLVTWILTATFAFHPMIVFYGANGMTEAPFIFFLLVAARALARWLDRPALRPLITAGVALGCAYLTRYEAAAAGLASIIVVAFVSYRRAVGDARQRRLVAAGDAVILAAPFVFAALAWAVVSWVIVGSPFQAFSSVYGNASYVSIGAAQIPRGAGIMTRQITALQPLLIVALVAAILCGVRRKDARLLSALSVVGAALAFQVVAFIRGGTYGFFRYYILVVPFAALLAGSVAPVHVSSRRLRSRLVAGALGLAAIAMVLPGLPVAAVSMGNVELAPQEAPLRSIADRDETLTQRRRLVEPFTIERGVAAYLDDLRLPEGSILLDVAFGFPIVLDSRRPRQFVIPPDRDFQAALAAPVQFGVRYLLVTPNEGLGRIDALNRAYPRIFETGAGMARLVREFRGTGAPWRLYAIAD